MDELKRKLIANLQGYLRERQDFVASIPTMDPIWSAPFDIIGNIFEPILGSVDNKCPNLFLLFDNIVRSENIRAGAIQFVIKIINQDDTAEWNSKFEFLGDNVVYKFKKVSGQDIDSKVAIYLGTSGCQAFYSIIENFLRNITRHSNKSFLGKVVEYSNKIIKKENPNVNDATPLIIAIEFHINDDENDKKEDYILTKIYCNSYEWEKINDGIWVIKDEEGKLRYVVLNENISEEDAINKLSSEFSDEQDLRAKIFNKKFNPETPEGKIIDETGKIIEGNWGLKEMRICASFLRGLKITDYETPLPKDEPPILVPYVQPYEKDNNKGSLGYKFYLPKVKDLLIISKDIASDSKTEVSDLKEQGIYIESDINKITELQSRGKFTHEFVVIDVDEEENVEFLKKNILKLPYKLFFITKNGNLPDNVRETIKKIRWDLSSGGGDINNLKYLTINKNELAQWLKNDNQSLEINGDTYDNFKTHEKTILEIRKRWAQYLWKNENLPKVGFYPFTENINQWSTNNLIFCEEAKSGGQTLSPNFITQVENSIILLHKFDRIDEIINQHPLCILPFAHAIPSQVRSIKMAFNNSRGKLNFEVINLYLDTVEIASTNILIIDERLYEDAGKLKKVFDKDMIFANSWIVQNVLFANLEKINSVFTLKIREKDGKETELKLSNENNECGINLSQQIKNRLHFLVIHQTIISPKIGGKEEFERFLNSLPKELKPWYIIITSGRGHPAKNDMYDKSKFYHFSNLRNFIDTQNKFLLVKTFFVLKEVVSNA